MNQAANFARKNATRMPRAIADRMKATPANGRGEAENMLKDIAFVLSLTRRIKDEILAKDA